MLISDISYIENVSEKNIEGGNGAFFLSSKFLSIFGEARASGASGETLTLGAATGNKTISYGSSIEAEGLV